MNKQELIMNKNKTSLLLLTYLVLCSLTSKAVQVSPTGTGEVLIYPYYSVNNGLNTLYSVVNTTPDTKAIKVQFLEGNNAEETLDFNVYLSAYDVWTGALIPSTSNQADHSGEPSATHISNDASCTPFLVKDGQEFLPFQIDYDDLSVQQENTSMQRAREGHFIIIEMASFSQSGTGTNVVDWADHRNVGVPASCAAIVGDWSDNGEWDSGGEENPTGGLFGTASLVDVAQGISYTYDALALINFWQGSAYHTEPGSLEPNLSDAYPESKVILASGDNVTSQWNSGYQAVSSVLMSAEIMNEYALETAVNGQTEWVVSFPTKRHHLEGEIRAPFFNDWDGMDACEGVAIQLLDRNQYHHIFNTICPIFCGLIDPRPQLCQSSTVVEFFLPRSLTSDESRVLGSNNLLQLESPHGDNTTESGWAKIDFVDDEHQMASLEGHVFHGLPALGFSVQKYTNSQAQAGLLAQYGGLFKHKHTLRIEQ